MGTINDKLNEIKGTKNGLKQAFRNKGVTVNDSDTFRSYVQKLEDYKGIDTSDATAEPNHIQMGETAYVNGQKLEGTLQVSDDPFVNNNPRVEYTESDGLAFMFNKSNTEIIRESTLIRTSADTNKLQNAIPELDSNNIKEGVNILGVEGSVVELNGESIEINPSIEEQSITPHIGYNAITEVTVKPVENVLAENIKAGEMILGIEGSFTTDATATASDMAEGKTAYVNGQKLTGNVEEVPIFNSRTFTANKNNISIDASKQVVRVPAEIDRNLLFRYHATVRCQAPYEGVARAINLTANKLKKDEVVLGITGTYEGESGGKVVLPNGTKFRSSTFTIFPAFDTSEMTDMSYMFYSCKQVIEINTSKFNTNSVTNMQYMFQDCNVLKNLDTSKFNTNNVTDMQYMFYNCYELENINVSNFNVENVTTFKGMFTGCRSITELNVSNFNTTKVADFDYIFNGCTNLTNIDLSNWNLRGVQSKRTISAMFSGCTSLTDDSLNSILKMFDTYIHYDTSFKTLKYIGLTQEQANRCTTLSNWQALVDKNWTTGY